MILFFLKREKWMKYVEEVLGSGDPKKHPDWESSPKWFLARQRERGAAGLVLDPHARPLKDLRLLIKY